MTRRGTLNGQWFKIGVLLFLGIWGLTACATAPQTPKELETVAFDATTYWKTDYGPMRIQIHGMDGVGVYPDYKGELKLRLRAPGVLEGFWIQPASKRQCRFEVAGSVYWGTVRFERISKQNIAGKWAYCNEAPGTGGNWNGVQIGHAISG